MDVLCQKTPEEIPVSAGHGVWSHQSSDLGTAYIVCCCRLAMSLRRFPGPRHVDIRT